VVARASTDDAGTFVLQAPAAGAYRLRVQRIGYRAYQSSIALTSRVEVNLGVRLAAVAVELAPVTVEAAQNGYLLNRGFYQRKVSERGTFLDPVAVEKRASNARLATDIFIGLPGVEIREGGLKLRTCRTVGSAGGASAGGPRIYIDGVESGSDIMWSLQPNDILAVEVYMGAAQIPLTYGGTNTPCGVILIWAKH